MPKSKKLKGRPISGWLVLDKPIGLGSMEVVSKVKSLFEAQEAGHAGTLDPLASGMLPIAFGNATKTISYLMSGRKIYEFNVTWGEERSTDDVEGEVICSSERRPTSEEIHMLLSKYTGIIEQVPPQFSAIRICGERAYNLARNGIRLKLFSRKAEIISLELLKSIDINTACFRVECSKGTYIRALARDLGQDLGCYGYISSLRRTFVSPFFEKRLVSFLELMEFERIQAQNERLQVLDTYILKTTEALSGLMHFSISDMQANYLRMGRSVLVSMLDNQISSADAYVTSKDELISIGQIGQGRFHPYRVFS